MTEVVATIHRCLNRNFLGGERRLLSMFGGGVRSFPLGFLVAHLRIAHLKIA